jgi:acylpyruvate hydrolase
MRLVSFPGGFGRVEGDVVVPMGRDIVEWLETGEAVDGEAVPLASLELLAPVPRPRTIVCVGRNYVAHAAERGVDPPAEPILFPKFVTSVAPAGAVVTVPGAAEEPDYEAELGVVIGQRAKDVSRADALGYVAGYTCLNDLTARDLQRSGGQWTRGKAIDGFLPMGPELVTSDEVGDPGQLKIECRVNGETVQSSHTSLMIFPIDELIAFITQTVTLQPGDVIATGTPAGVGAAMDPPRFLADGDVVEVEIERVGRLETRISAPHRRL